MSFHLTVLKVLAGHPDGRLPVAELTRAVTILMSSGPDWTRRMKTLLAQTPDLDIFGDALVSRDADGWQITEAGMSFLAKLESTSCPPTSE